MSPSGAVWRRVSAPRPDADVWDVLDISQRKDKSCLVMVPSVLLFLL